MMSILIAVLSMGQSDEERSYVRRRTKLLLHITGRLFQLWSVDDLYVTTASSIFANLSADLHSKGTHSKISGAITF
jgi:hypothetical protein